MIFADLAYRWVKAKESERQAIENRRAIEDEIKKLIDLKEDVEGARTLDGIGYKIKVVTRIDRKVDAIKLQELAAENGLTEHLSSLFRWKPEINMSAWKAADEAITRPLLDAITAKPGRPSFAIENFNSDNF